MKKIIIVFVSMFFVLAIFILYDLFKNYINYNDIKSIKICKLPYDISMGELKDNEILNYSYSELNKENTINCLKKSRLDFVPLVLWKDEIPIILIFKNGNTKRICISEWGFYSVENSYLFLNRIPDEISNQWKDIIKFHLHRTRPFPVRLNIAK